MKIPQHVAIILDGNGRWAKKKGMPRNYGHTMGAKNVEVICKAAYDMGISYVTMYAFSTENWNRPDSEVSALMKLLNSYLKNCIKTAKKNNMQVRVIGDVSKLDETMQRQIIELEKESAYNTGLHFQIALNYGGRDEMIRAIKKIAEEYKDNNITLDDITQEKIVNYLDTKDIPDPDLLIRTSGEQRISNFLMWQSAYSELYFTDVPWPDFSPAELQKAVEEYDSRDRRYGKVKEEY